MRRALERLRAFFHKSPLDRDLDSEMASHLAFAIEENLRRGLTPEEASRQALVRFGGVAQSQERHREARGLPALDVLLQDLRYTFRTLRRDRGFASVAVLILALGIGANIAVFSVVNTILLRPLPFRDPRQLVWMSSERGVGGLSAVTYTVSVYEEFLRHNRSFEDVTAYDPFFGDSDYKLTGRGEPQQLAAVPVAENFFPTLGVRPFLGRLFTREECQKGGRAAVLLGYFFWQRQFAADPAIVGQALVLNNRPVTVVGVLPASFDFGSVFAPGLKMDIFVPGIMDLLRNDGNTLALLGRLRPGVTVAQAQAEVDVLMPQLRAAHKDWYEDYATAMTGLKDHVSGKLRRSLVVLWCAVGLILLIVCVNLSNLLLARAAARAKEFAMRGALGAGRGRIVRQLLTESLVLAAGGAALGIGIAFAVTGYLARQGSIALPLLSTIRVDGAALAWTLLIALAAALLFGLAPSLKVSSGNLQDALKDTGHGLSAGRKHERMRAVLVVSEVALACVLLVGAGLMLRSFLRVLDVDLGFQPNRAASIKIDYDDGGKAERRGPILQEILRRVSAVPGIQSAGIVDMLPLDRNRSWGLGAKGRIYGKNETQAAFVYIATPGYLRAIGMQLRAGRDFNWQDQPRSERVVIVNQAAARYHWPGQNPVGRTALVNGVDTRVIGVIADVRECSVEDSSGIEMYLPETQADPEGAELVVRSQVPPEALASSLMRTLRVYNPEQPAAEFRPVQSVVDHAISPRRFFALLVAIFAGLGLLLASLGIYGVISYSVTRQTQEIGIRMALGATTERVQLGVIAGTMRLVLAGIALGTATSLLAAKWIAALLFNTEPTDPAAFAGMMLLLSAVALIAGYIPARRASRIDPMIALRGN
ncbi:MAG: ABC transporter permease [Bryobacteraceae bacterium]